MKVIVTLLIFCDLFVAYFYKKDYGQFQMGYGILFPLLALVHCLFFALASFFINKRGELVFSRFVIALNLVGLLILGFHT